MEIWKYGKRRACARRSPAHPPGDKHYSLVPQVTLWGIPGMLLATPITAIMKILFMRLELLEPLAHLLAGRLAPEEIDSG